MHPHRFIPKTTVHRSKSTYSSPVAKQYQKTASLLGKSLTQLHKLNNLVESEDKQIEAFHKAKASARNMIERDDAKDNLERAVERKNDASAKLRRLEDMLTKVIDGTNNTVKQIIGNI